MCFIIQVQKYPGYHPNESHYDHRKDSAGKILLPNGNHQVNKFQHRGRKIASKTLPEAKSGIRWAPDISCRCAIRKPLAGFLLAYVPVRKIDCRPIRSEEIRSDRAGPLYWPE